MASFGWRPSLRSRSDDDRPLTWYKRGWPAEPNIHVDSLIWYGTHREDLTETCVGTRSGIYRRPGYPEQGSEAGPRVRRRRSVWRSRRAWRACPASQQRPLTHSPARCREDAGDIDTFIDSRPALAQRLVGVRSHPDVVGMMSGLWSSAFSTRAAACQRPKRLGLTIHPN
jgi:hypothetical protein